MTTENQPWILPFDEKLALELQLAGGKGANLARLAQAGFPVPGGFLVTTRAYRDFVDANQFGERIFTALKFSGPQETGAEDPAALEAVSASIRGLFAAGSIPPALRDGITAAYRGMTGAEDGPVAVRSSATAEDLPEMSFAGQQDTYLNICGEEALLRAVVDCWSSLWTARAIGYRLRNHVEQESAALAVVVQCMVQSQASGVLFTANPLTGLRTETVIDATFGLGEALVSGQVEPDHYVVDAAAGKIISKKLGAKALAIHGQVGGGTVVEHAARGDQQALSDEQILALAGLGQQVAALYGSPQDIEWALADGSLALLQSRAVTSLFPTPEDLPPEPLKVLLSFAAIQGIFEPITPLGRSAIKTLFAAGSELFQYKETAETQRVIFTAGERLWVNFTGPLSNSIGRRLILSSLSIIEPTAHQAIETIKDDPRLLPEREGVRFRSALRLAGFFGPLAWNVLLNLIAPRARRTYIVKNGEAILADMRAMRDKISGDPFERLAQQADLLPTIIDERLGRMFLLFVSAIASGMASFNALRVLGLQLPEEISGERSNGWPRLTLEITRGLPNNPTTEMDLALWAIARQIRKDPAAFAELNGRPASELAQRYQSGTMSAPVRELIGRFLDRYGGRGLGEIDMGRERWLENPIHIFDVLSGYLQIKEGEQAPDAVFARGAQEAQSAVDRLVEGLRHTRGGWFKARLARFFAVRLRELLGARESPKFFAVRMMSIARHEIHETGKALAGLGVIDRPDDFNYLTLPEMKAFSTRESRDWRGLIAQRRAAYQRELLRRQVPRLLLSDGRAFYEGIANHTGNSRCLMGSPVSPGSVEGRVRVVLDPRQAGLVPGEIMVCPGTDPSWTPLFLTAGGLIMEVGGMMTHGAVVAREYGIPAVVGVDHATQRLVTGQCVRLDGSSGQIDVLDD